MCVLLIVFFVKFRYRNTVSDLSLKGYAARFVDHLVANERARGREELMQSCWQVACPVPSPASYRGDFSTARVIFCEYCLLTMLQIRPALRSRVPDPGPIRCDRRYMRAALPLPGCSISRPVKNKLKMRIFNSPSLINGIINEN